MNVNPPDMGERDDAATPDNTTPEPVESVVEDTPVAEGGAETALNGTEAAPEQPAAEEAPAEQSPAEDAPVEDAPAEITAAEVSEAVSALDTGEMAAAPGAGEDATSGPIPSTDSTGKIARGQLVEGEILRTSPIEVVVRLADGIEGVIPGRELERMTRQTVETLRPGATITVYVVNPRDVQGNVLLSINRAMEELDWKEAEGYQKSQSVYEGNIAGYNKGGLIVRFGRLRGFVPQSQIADDRRARATGGTPQENYEPMVNEPVSVKVVEVDRARNRLILSERAASRETRERRKAALVNELKVGDVRTGRVVSLEDFGAFVDVGGAEGLVHLTEISWKHVTHPREALNVGQEVRVEVISVDPKRKRIGLSIKRQEADPWDEVAATYEPGQLVRGTITKLTKFGAFARLVDAPDIEGLIHISELSEDRVMHPKEVVNEGDTLTLRVVKVDVKNRRLGLSLKRVNSAEYLDKDWGR